MVNSLITHLQVFGIGLTFGMAGPCFFTCAPVLITYVAGRGKDWRKTLKDIFVFLSGRLSAYIMLGFFAGLSGAALRAFTSSGFSTYLQPMAGAVTIFFALLILLNRDGKECCQAGRGRLLDLGGLFSFGLLIGLSPCAPLLALLFDIVLMSKSAIDGALYALSFGLGTFISGAITIGIVAGLITRIPANLIRSKAISAAFKIACALLLAALGLGLILKSHIF
jgi:sulfite exporter TauE/SafE